MSSTTTNVTKQKIKSLTWQIEHTKQTQKQMDTLLHEFEGELRQIQRECPHEDVRVDHIWQGGGLYYDLAECTICGKKGDRYNRPFTQNQMQKDAGEHFDPNMHIAPKYSTRSKYPGERDW